MTDSIDGAQLEHLAAPARHVLKIDEGHAYATLVPTKEGSPAAKDALELIKPATLTAAPAEDRIAAAAALSGLWLWHDFLDASHTISQGIDTADGSLWHAIMHRREGDFSNAKYWYRRVGDHPAYRSIAAKVDAVTQQMPVDKPFFRLTATGWNPSALVDLAEALHNQPQDPRYAAAVTIQRIEWRTIFEHCVRAAAGR